MTLRSGRESATKTPLLVALVAATKGATSDRLKRLKKLSSCTTKVATKVSSGRLVFLSLPPEGKDDDQRPRPLGDQFLSGSSTSDDRARPSRMPVFVADILERLVERREKNGLGARLPHAHAQTSVNPTRVNNRRIAMN